MMFIITFIVGVAGLRKSVNTCINMIKPLETSTQSKQYKHYAPKHRTLLAYIKISE